jgi:hypothetical protein
VDRKGWREGLDYTLLTLLPNTDLDSEYVVPEVAWGELTATTDLPAIDEQIWFIQHPWPGVNPNDPMFPKKVGYYQDSFGGVHCKVDLINQTYGRSAPNSQVAYACDSSNGSSGSPIVAAQDPLHHVVALHHFGGVDDDPCLNAGTAMTDICADAGSLLLCAGDGNGCTDLLPTGAACTEGSECCSNKCKGRPGNRTCR